MVSWYIERSFNHQLLRCGELISPFHSKKIDMLTKILSVIAGIVCLAVAEEFTRLDQQEGLYQGDIILPRTRNGIKSSTERWPSNTVIYTIADTTWNQTQMRMIQDAMDAISRYTCIKFNKRTNEPGFVKIIRSDRCSSDVGYTGREQILTLGSGCWQFRTVVHELLHSVGLWHHHTRTDRDQYVEVYKTNAQSDFQFNYNISDSDARGLPYDFLSVMHYEKDAFSKDGKLTLIPREPYRAYLNQIGRVDYPSDGDFELVRRIYGCTASYAAPPRQNPPTVAVCKDKLDWCSTAMKDDPNGCSSKAWGRMSCIKSCNLCGPQNGRCEDKISGCSQRLIDCYSDTYVMNNCRRTCYLC